MESNGKLIAWSKNGFIAYSNFVENKFNLQVTYLYSVDGYSWKLAAPKNLVVKAPANEDEITSNIMGKPHSVKRRKLDDHASNGNGASSTLKPPPSVSMGTSASNSSINSNGNSVDHDKDIANNTNDNLGTVNNEILNEVSHIDWSTNGDYLACLSNCGSMTIFAGGITRDRNNDYVFTSYNDFVTVYNDNIIDAPSEDIKQTLNSKIRPNLFSNLNRGATNYSESCKVLAFEWLNVDKASISMAPAIRIATIKDNSSSNNDNNSTNDDPGFAFNYELRSVKPLGCKHPFSAKHACIGVRANGELCLWYQSSHKLNFFRVTQMLEDFDSNESLITLASLGVNHDINHKGAMILVTYQKSSQILSVYSITIDWGTIQEQKSNQSSNSGSVKLRVPKLLVEKICKQFCNSSYESIESIINLKVISPSNVNPESTLKILAGFKTYTGEEGVLSYELESISSKLNQVFLKVKSSSSNSKNRADNGTVKSEYFINLKEVLKFNEKKLIKVDYHSAFIYFIFSDGIVEIRDIKDFSKIVNSNSTDDEIPQIISSLYDAGFHIPRVKEEIKYALISPCSSALVYLPSSHNAGPDSKTTPLKLILAESKFDSYEFTSSRRVLLSALFAKTHADSYAYRVCPDTLTALMRLEISKYGDKFHETLVTSIIKECSKSLNFNFIIEEFDKLLKHPPLSTLISLQMTLGTFKNWKRDKRGQIAWTLLNLKLSAFVIVLTLKACYTHNKFVKDMNKDRKIHSSVAYSNIKWFIDLLINSVGVLQWSMSFITFICQDLLHLKIALTRENKKNSGAEVMIKLFNENLSTTLLLAKIPRVLLKNTIRVIKQLLKFIKLFLEENKAFNFSLTYETSSYIDTIIEKSLVNIDVFDKFLTSVEFAAKGTHQKIVSMVGNQQDVAKVTQALENQLMCDATIPKEYLDTSKMIMKCFSDTITKETDCSKLYFADLSWLGLYKESEITLRSDKLIQDQNLGDTDLEKTPNEPQFLFTKNEKIDYLRKTLMKNDSNGGFEKKCVRCGTVATKTNMISIDQITYDTIRNSVSNGEKGRERSFKWDMAFQRNCFCGAPWVNT